jgi:hypothetical protein
MDPGQICGFVRARGGGPVGGWPWEGWPVGVRLGGLILVAPVAVDTDASPAGGGIVENEGEAGTAGASADHIEVDDGVLAVVGELREREAKDGFGLGGEMLPFFEELLSPGFGFVHSGVCQGEDGVRFCGRYADGLMEPGLLPVVGIVTREVDFLGELVERGYGDGFLQVVFDPFVIVIFHEAAGVSVDNQIIAGEGAIDDGMKNFIYKRLGGRGWYGIGTGGSGGYGDGQVDSGG